jgi:hypothetical protein
MVESTLTSQKISPAASALACGLFHEFAILAVAAHGVTLLVSGVSRRVIGVRQGYGHTARRIRQHIDAVHRSLSLR